MKLHSRTLPLNRKRAELTLLLQDFRDKSNMTDIEWLQTLQEEVTRTLRYMLRDERHPGEDKRADEA